MSMLDEGEDIAEAIQLQKAQADSDGSFKGNHGTSASIIEGANESKCITYVNTVPGPASIQSAYRSELAGILSSLTHVKIICDKFEINDGSITIACDGEQALN